MQFPVFPAHDAEQDQGAQNAGKQCGKRHSVYSQMEHKDQYRISHDVYHIHENRNEHRNFGISHGSAQSRAGIIDTHKREG